jgi:hypothetical protein
MKVSVLSLFFLLFCCAPALADSSGLVKEWDLHLKVESFDWREYGSSGARILKESGPLYGVGGGALLDLNHRGLLLKLDGELFGSVVDYQGETQFDGSNPRQSERPVKTDVYYFGTDLRADLGWNFPVESFSCQPIAGIGYRWWLRGLQDSTAVATDSVPFDTSGYTETWQSLYGRVGARAQYQHDSRLSLFASGGAKYPFYTENSVDFAGSGRTAFHPVGNWSGFAETGVTYRQLRLSLSYDGFRFAPSHLVRVGTKDFYQPKSCSDLFGLSLGWIF